MVVVGFAARVTPPVSRAYVATAGARQIKSVVASSDAGAAFQLGPLDLKLNLVVPKVAELSALTASELTLTVTRWTTEPRGELALTLTGKLRDAPRVFDVRLEIETFVRDVVGGPKPELLRTPSATQTAPAFFA